MKQYVYVALDIEEPKHPHKIGRTEKDPKERLRGLKSYYKREFEYIHVYEVNDMFKTEDLLHEHFINSRKGDGDFFNLTTNDLISLMPGEDLPYSITSGFIRYLPEFCTRDVYHKKINNSHMLPEKSKPKHGKRSNNLILKSYKLEASLIERMDRFLENQSLSGTATGIIRQAVHEFLVSKGY